VYFYLSVIMTQRSLPGREALLLLNSQQTPARLPVLIYAVITGFVKNLNSMSASRRLLKWRLLNWVTCALSVRGAFVCGGYCPRLVGSASVSGGFVREQNVRTLTNSCAFLPSNTTLARYML